MSHTENRFEHISKAEGFFRGMQMFFKWLLRQNPSIIFQKQEDFPLYKHANVLSVFGSLKVFLNTFHKQNVLYLYGCVLWNILSKQKVFLLYECTILHLDGYFEKSCGTYLTTNGFPFYGCEGVFSEYQFLKILWKTFHKQNVSPLYE